MVNKMTERKLFIRQRIRQKIEKWGFIWRHLGQVQPSAYLECPRNIELGAESKLSYGVMLFATPTSKIIIGENSHLGTRVIAYAFTTRNTYAPTTPNKSITIGDNTLVGANTVILQGAVIGDNCVIGANSTILEDTIIPSNELWAGSPARFKRNLKNP